jgi:hypothetical protein
MSQLPKTKATFYFHWTSMLQNKFCLPTFILDFQHGIYNSVCHLCETLMYMVWHVDKHKITFKLVIDHWTNEVL